MSIRIDGCSRRFHLRPPADHGQRKQSSGAGQRQNDLALPHNVALIASAIAVRANALLSGMEDGRHPGEDLHRRHVDATIDKGRHVRAGFLHVVLHGSGGWVNHQTSVVHRLLFGRLGAHDGDLGLLVLFRRVKVEQLFEREIGTDVAVQHEERRRVAGPDLIAEVVHAASGAQHGELLQVARSVDRTLLRLHSMYSLRSVCSINLKTESS